MPNVHRYIEKVDDIPRILHHIEFHVDESNKLICDSLRAYEIENDSVGQILVSADKPLDALIQLAVYSIMVADGLMDVNGNSLYNHTE
jgi:hypothetical protein